MSGRADREYDAVVAGYVGLDMTPAYPETATLAGMLRPGTIVEVGGLTVSLGGAVPNTGVAMKIFGRKVRLIGLVGDDALGGMILGMLAKHGLRGGIRRAKGASSAYCVVVAPRGTDRIFLESPGCNALFSSADIDCETVRRARLFHLGYPPLLKRLFADGGEELERIFSKVSGMGVATSLDMSLPDPASASGKADWRAILGRTLPHVDVFVPSIEEVLFAMMPETHRRIASRAAGGDLIESVPERVYRDLGDRIMALGVKVLLIKAGHRGAYLRTADAGMPADAAARTPRPALSPKGRGETPALSRDEARAARVPRPCRAGEAHATASLGRESKGLAEASPRPVHSPKGRGVAGARPFWNALGLDAASWDSREMWVPVFPADGKKAKNATGAGDSAVAAFLSAILDGETAEAAGRFAMLAGRDNLYGEDALSGLRDWAAMRRELASGGLAPAAPRLSADFEFRAETGVWDAKPRRG